MRLLSFSLVPIALGAVAFAAFDAGKVHEHVLDELERKLDEKFEGDFEARRLTGSLVHGFTAHDVEIRDVYGGPVAHIDELQVEASAFSLLDGDFRFDKARLVRPVVFVEELPDGDRNVEHVFRSRRSDAESRPPRPPGQVLFEMTEAEVIDGKIYYVNSIEPDKPSRVVTAQNVQAKGQLRVLSRKTVIKRLDRLDADVVSTFSPTLRKVRATGTRVEKNEITCDITADTLEVDEHWRLDKLDVSIPRSEAPPETPVALSGRASTPDGGWLDVEGQIRDDDTYDFDLEARDFEPRTWPGAPDWSWLVLDGKGSIAGRGWSRDEMDTTLRWSANDIALAGERVDTLRLVARAVKGRLQVDKLDLKASKTSLNTSGHVTEAGKFALSMALNTTGNKHARRLAKRLDIPLDDATRLRVWTKAKGKLDLSALADSAQDPLQMLAHADAESKWTARDLVLDGNRYGASSGSFELLVPSVQRKDRDERMLAFKTRGVLTDIRVGDHRAEKARMLVSGAFRPAKDGAKWPLDTLKARGGIDLEGYRHDKLRARRVAVNLNVRGAFPLGKGAVSALMTGVRVKGEKFNSVQMKLSLLDDQKFRFRSKTKISVAKLRLPIYLDIKGRHARDLKALAVDKMSLGRPGMRWKTRKPGLVLFKDDAVVLKSLTLKRGGRKVRLDGAYGRGKKGSISEICDRLKTQQLKGLFGPVGGLLDKIF